MINTNYNNYIETNYKINNKDNYKKDLDTTLKDEKVKNISKIELIKKQIEEGSYKIDLDKIANSIAKELII